MQTTTREVHVPVYQRGKVLALGRDGNGRIKMATIEKVRNGCQDGCWQYQLRFAETDRTAWFGEDEVKAMEVKYG